MSSFTGLNDAIARLTDGLGLESAPRRFAIAVVAPKPLPTRP